jgi:hypothetical protein
MHKSGTTLISQILHRSGINMGESIDPKVSYDRGNKYERLSTRALNLEILGLKDIYTPSYDLDVSPDAFQLTEDQRRRMREIIQRCNQAYPNWGFKDPRTCLVYPLWASELPEHKIIAVYRSPGEIWPRYRKKRLRHCYKNPSRAWKFMKGWCRYNSNVLSYLQNANLDFLVLSYGELMASDAEFNRLQEFVGIELNDQRKKSLYRNRTEEYPLIEIATWLVHKQTGCTPGKIMEQFEALRQT